MQEKKVVIIGSGSGTDIALVGLKRHTSRLTALISTFDASSRRQRQSEGVINGHEPCDDVRSSLLALGPDPATTHIMERLFAYRFSESIMNSEANFGSLFLSALTDITGSADLAIRAAARVLNVHGEVLPPTMEDCPLLVERNDGTEVKVCTPTELIAASEGVGLRRVRLAYPAAALDEAIQAVHSADIIVLGPADLYFGLLAPLQLQGLSEAIVDSGAVKIFTCNLLTQPNTTDRWPASRFIRAVLNQLGGGAALDGVIINSAALSPDLLSAKAEQGSFPVQFDLEECLSFGLNVIVRPVASTGTLLHDPEKLARTILFLGGGRSARKSEKRRVFSTGSLPELATHAPGVWVPEGAGS